MKRRPVIRHVETRSLERTILRSAKRVLNNPKLKMAGIIEWAIGDVTPQNKDEVVVGLPAAGVNICVCKTDDRRGRATPSARSTPKQLAEASTTAWA